MDWKPDISWQSPAGVVLKMFFDALPKDRHFHITLFGSSPLQLGVDSAFLSGDVDLFCDETRDLLDDVLSATGLSDKARTLYIQLCSESNFRSSPRWQRRAFTTEAAPNVTLTLPHPIDILIAKLHRLADKDLAAFRLVIDRTGHPTEDELRRELQFAVDLFRPNFDEEMVGDITTNTRVLWQELWGKEIDVRKEIIRPAIEARRDGYDFPKADYKAQLRQLGES